MTNGSNDKCNLLVTLYAITLLHTSFCYFLILLLFLGRLHGFTRLGRFHLQDICIIQISHCVKCRLSSGDIIQLLQARVFH